MQLALAAAETGIVGLVAGVLTTAAFLPQAARTLATRSTDDLSLPTFSMLSVGTGLWLVHGLIQRDWAVVGANAITFPLITSIWSMVLRDRIRKRRAGPGASAGVD